MGKDRTKTILVVDDMRMFRDLGALFLARAGRVLTASSGEEGLEVARNEEPDLVLTDLRMPGMDGLELCRALRSDPAFKSVPILVMMGAHEADARGDVIRAGADDVLDKPLARMALTAAVNRFLNYDHVRGQPRVRVDAPVRIVAGENETWGTVRNLSRGGLFVETHLSLVPAEEIELHFRLPESGHAVEPNAQVVWCRMPVGTTVTDPPGLGLRFLDIDAPTSRIVDDFVYERSESIPSIAAGAPV
jgi:CheY-like chemotaxis protein/Tfp pilus assembly protein PilZ